LINLPIRLGDVEIKDGGCSFFPQICVGFPGVLRAIKKSFRKSLLQFSYVIISECVNISRVPFHASCTQHAKWIIFFNIWIFKQLFDKLTVHKHANHLAAIIGHFNK